MYFQKRVLVGIAKNPKWMFFYIESRFEIQCPYETHDVPR